MSTTEVKSSDLGLCAVIGGYGYLGYFVALHLSHRGYKVRILDLSDSPRAFDKSLFSADGCFAPLGNESLISHIRCDITKSDELQQGLVGVETIFHTCAICDIRKAPNRDILYGVNVGAMETILKLINTDAELIKTVKRIIYTGSIAAIAKRCTHASLVSEDLSRVNTKDYSYHDCHYAKSKAMAELLMEKYMSNTGNNISYCILRITCLSGPFDPMFGKTEKERYDTLSSMIKFPYRTLSADVKKDLSNLDGELCQDKRYDKNGKYRCKITINYVENIAMTLIAIARKLSLKNARNKKEKEKEKEKEGEWQLFENEIFHTKDFDINRWDYVRYELLEQDKNGSEYKIPYLFLIYLAMMWDVVQLLIYTLFGKLIGDPVVSLCEYGIDMMSFDRTVSDRKLKNRLKQDEKTGQLKDFQDIRLYTTQEILQRMRAWIKVLEST